MGTKTTTQNQQVEKSRPPAWARAGLATLGRRISNIIPNMPGPRYKGDFIAQPTGADALVPQYYGEAARLADKLVNPARRAIGEAFTGPSYGGPRMTIDSFGGSNPGGMEAAVTAATQPVMRQLMEQALPSLQSSALESGAYGSNRSMEVLPAQVIRDYGRQGQEIAAQMAYDDFQQREQRELEGYNLATQRGLGTANVETQRLSQIPSLLDTAMRMQAGAGDLQAQNAAYRRMLEQLGIDNQLAKNEYAVRYPFQGLDVAASLLNGLATPWGTRSSYGTQTQSTGGAGPIIQGAIGAGMMAAGMPGGMAGLFGSAAPAAAGSAFINPSLLAGTYGAGVMSDRRLKRDIQHVGELNGLPVYTFRYLWSKLPTVGVMADEVEKIRPEALGPRIMGFQTVDYSKLGVA